MTSWSMMDLGDASLADAASERVRREFEAAALPGDAAIYFRHESEGRLHCSLVLYFSPACDVLASRLGAQACHRPARHDLALLAGPSRLGNPDIIA